MKPGASTAPVARVVLLGASNLTFGLAHAIEEARSRLGGPLEVLVAHGLGRSYGTFSCVLGRGLPGVVRSGLWDALGTASPAPTFAAVTDVGNDIVYGASVETILEWVRRCLGELKRVDARIVMTLPPMHIETMGRTRYVAFRTLFFPTRRLPFEEMQVRVGGLRSGLSALAREFGAGVVLPSSTWFGVDPLHVRRRYRGAAWHEIASKWDRTPAGDLRRRPDLWTELALPLVRPRLWWLFGARLGRSQPAARLRDGSSVACY